MVKRTYSKYGKGQRPTSYDPNWVPDSDTPKRAKVDDSDELRLSKGRTEGSSSLLKKGLKFGGPTPLPNELMDIDKDTVVTKKTSVFDRVLHSGRYQPAKPSQIKPRSSQKDSSIAAPAQQQSNELRNYQLPTPPVEIQKAHQAHKEPYVLKAHEEGKTPAPRKNILGDRLSKRSRETVLWHTNQTNSPLLQLPAEVRGKIFEYALGGNTIKIGYETYRTTPTYEKPKTSVPIFKYGCTVYHRRTNPFKLQESSKEIVAKCYSPLNNICRQLYTETATLPYKLNVIAFSSATVMLNFLYQEDRLSRQQRDAITELVLPDGLLQQNMLNDLVGLEKFYLGCKVSDQARGWYTVVRKEGYAPKLVQFASRRH
ncbi:hypothetical protein J1614_007510 [Plenodomus biglobosus]|nr:hypothetical protein J1614_007510 [Plenodomus biglobosus]